MRSTRPFHDSLKIDLYELTMAAGYFESKKDAQATFELSCHTMPDNRSYLIACGLEQAIEYILNLRFHDEDIKFLKSLPAFQSVSSRFFDYLKTFRFRGDVWAMSEGEIFFAKEPIIQVEAVMIEAQIMETYLLSIMNIESLVASKAARVCCTASFDGIKRGVIDFGTRRAHGPQAGVLAARAAYIAGCLGTSNVFAGKKYGIPLFGTVAHSWVEAFDTEVESFDQYYRVFKNNTILLIDTYDTMKAVKEITKLKYRNNIKAVRIDSGNLAFVSNKVRTLLDQAGLQNIKIIASGNLNEYKISDLIQARSPIDFFGVGTDMVTSRDCPALDLTYKLVQIKERQREVQYKAKYSQGKKTIPGRKQVFRKFNKQGYLERDVIGLCTERTPPGTKPLLKQIIKNGHLVRGLPKIDHIRRKVSQNLNTLPKTYFSIKRKRNVHMGLTRVIAKLS